MSISLRLPRIKVSLVDVDADLIGEDRRPAPGGHRRRRPLLKAYCVKWHEYLLQPYRRSGPLLGGPDDRKGRMDDE